MRNLDQLTTPAYIIKQGVLEDSIGSFKNSLDKFFPKNILGYSLKTNSLPYILKKVKEYGGYAEVVSKDEYDLARLIGFEIKEIIYNGPLKSKSTFIEAIEGGAIVNIETKREIEWLKALPKEKSFTIGIRVNIDLGVISPNDAKDNEDYSRFGFSFENGELTEALKEIQSLLNVTIDCLHVHRTTLSRSVDVFKHIAKYVSGIVSFYKMDSIKKIDIGGGYYGIMDNKPTFEEYCKAIFEGLSESFLLEKTTIIVEPGNAIVASAIDFVTEIIDVKKIRDFYVCTTDGSRNDIDPFYKKESYFYDLISSKSGFKVDKQIITGGTCLEYDKIFEVKEKTLLSVGDKVVYRSVGAYTMTLSPLFIRFFPNVYLENNNEYCLIRENWSAKNFFAIYDTKNI